MFSRQGEKRIANQLTRSVICDVPTTLDCNKISAHLSGVATQVVRKISRWSICKNMRVLKQQQPVVCPVTEHAFLHCQCLCIRDSPQPPHSQGRWCGVHGVLLRPLRTSRVFQEFSSHAPRNLRHTHHRRHDDPTPLPSCPQGEWRCSRQNLVLQ